MFRHSQCCWTELPMAAGIYLWKHLDVVNFDDITVITDLMALAVALH